MKQILETDSIDELAEFWDTHDLTEFEDETGEVQEPIIDKGIQSVMRTRLPPNEMAALKPVAESKGINHSDLVREWVSEKLRTS